MDPDDAGAAAPLRGPNQKIPVLGVVLLGALVALLAWYTCVVWLQLFEDPESEIYIPGKYGGGVGSVVTAAWLSTITLIIGVWAVLTLALWSVSRRRRYGLGVPVFFLTTSGILVLVCIGAAALSDDPGMIYAVCGTVAVLSALILAMVLHSRRDVPEGDAEAADTEASDAAH